MISSINLKANLYLKVKFFCLCKDTAFEMCFFQMNTSIIIIFEVIEYVVLCSWNNIRRVIGKKTSQFLYMMYKIGGRTKVDCSCENRKPFFIVSIRTTVTLFSAHPAYALISYGPEAILSRVITQVLRSNKLQMLFSRWQRKALTRERRYDKESDFLKLNFFE